MKTLERYCRNEIVRAVIFVLVAFVCLISFFDLFKEANNVGKGGYRIEHAFMYVLLSMPGYFYERMPTAALIGTIWSLAQFASRSEFTIMRVSGMSTLMMGRMLLRIGMLLVVLTILFGEVIAPWTTRIAENYKLQALDASMSSEFKKTGWWSKDLVRSNGLSGTITGSRVINARSVRADGRMVDIRLYEFDKDYHLVYLYTADHADFRGNSTWRFSTVTRTRFSGAALDADPFAPNAESTTQSQHMSELDLRMELTPQLLTVTSEDPDRMTAYQLYTYTRHLLDNHQTSTQYEIALWRKLVYPFSVLVMMALALPFAYLHTRAGGVSLKIFIGIMIGVSFVLLDNVFSHLGFLNTWPPFFTAVLPSALFMSAALAALRWVERK